MTTAAVSSSRAPTPALRTVRFVDATHGWAAGTGAVFATTDGGRAWARVYRGGADVQALDFVDRRHGWAVGTQQLLRTVDGGRTWSAAREPGLLLTRVDFVTPFRGFGVGGLNGRLFRTDDGGTTWRAVRRGRIDSVCFGGLRVGWAGGNGRVLRTDDGGRTWRTVFRPDPGWTVTLACAGRRVAYVLFVTGAAAGTTGQLYYRTLDSGRTWRLVLVDPMEASGHPGVAPSEPAPGTVQALDMRHAAVLGFCAPCIGGPLAAWAIRTTRDGGRTWHRTPLHDRCGPIAGDMWFADPRHGWLVTTEVRGIPGCARRDGRILATSDGGRTWRVQLG